MPTLVMPRLAEIDLLWLMARAILVVREVVRKRERESYEGDSLTLFHSAAGSARMDLQHAGWSYCMHRIQANR